MLFENVRAPPTEAIPWRRAGPTNLLASPPASPTTHLSNDTSILKADRHQGPTPVEEWGLDAYMGGGKTEWRLASEGASCSLHGRLCRIVSGRF
jgi:hypothetical protein